MVTLSVDYNGFTITEEQIKSFVDAISDLFKWLMECVQREVERLKEVCKQFTDAIKNDARRIRDAITEMLDNYDDVIKVEQSKRFYYGRLSVKVTDSLFFCPKASTKPIWSDRKILYHCRNNC